MSLTLRSTTLLGTKTLGRLQSKTTRAFTNPTATLSLLRNYTNTPITNEKDTTTTTTTKSTNDAWKTADGPHDFSYVSPQSADPRFNQCKPTIDYAKSMPNNFSAMRHEQILHLCVEGSHEARREALVRNVMAVDNIDYDRAKTIVDGISADRNKLFLFEYLPYHAGMGAALCGGLVSFPLIFHSDSVLWFNEKFVTADVPEAKDLETFLEVGSFSWGWMEPVIGQVSFVLLILQFARSQAINLGIKPYGNAMLSARSKRLIRKYPQYDPMFLAWFAESEAIYGRH